LTLTHVPDPAVVDVTERLKVGARPFGFELRRLELQQVIGGGAACAVIVEDGLDRFRVCAEASAANSQIRSVCLSRSEGACEYSWKLF
jgi:hypothetical protein